MTKEYMEAMIVKYVKNTYEHNGNQYVIKYYGDTYVIPITTELFTQYIRISIDICVELYRLLQEGKLPASAFKDYKDNIINTLIPAFHPETGFLGTEEIYLNTEKIRAIYEIENDLSWKMFYLPTIYSAIYNVAARFEIIVHKEEDIVPCAEHLLRCFLVAYKDK